MLDLFEERTALLTRVLEVKAGEAVHPVGKENHQAHVERVHELHRVSDRGEVGQGVEELIKRRVATPGKHRAPRLPRQSRIHVFPFQAR